MPIMGKTGLFDVRFMDARIVWNPYYAITGAVGAFNIDGVPAGKYKVTAWQPYVGEVSQELTVGAGAA